MAAAGSASEAVTAPSAAGAYVPALDGYRALAVGLVLLHHLVMLLPGPLPRGVVNLAENGWAGVDLFFVLSGFLITGILLRTVGKPRWVRNFWVRRLLRIVPLYYGFLVLFVVPGALAGRPLPFPPWVGFAFLTNFWIATTPQIDLGLVVLWSLSVEEQFYAVWPWVVHRMGRALPLVLVPMLLLAPALRVAVMPTLPAGSYFYTWCRMDALGWGALAAWLVHDGRYGRLVDACARLSPLVLAGGLAVAVAWPWPRDGLAFATFGYGALAVGAAIVVLGLASGRPGRVPALFARPALVHVGKVSFGLYLVHNWVFIALHQLVGPTAATGPTSVVLAVYGGAALLAIGIATLLFRGVETPFLALKDRLAPTGG